VEVAVLPVFGSGQECPGASPIGAEIHFWRAFARVAKMRARCPRSCGCTKRRCARNVRSPGILLGFPFDKGGPLQIEFHLGGFEVTGSWRKRLGPMYALRPARFREGGERTRPDCRFAWTAPETTNQAATGFNDELLKTSIMR